MKFPVRAALLFLASLLAGFAAFGFSPDPSGQGRGMQPDLIVSQIAFDRVSQETDASGKKYWIFNVIVHVKNQGTAGAGASQLQLERNNGAGGSFQPACATCLIDLPALPAGRETTLPPRQFNNANGAPSVFRATADSGHAVPESNESNNALTAEFKAPMAIVDKVPDIPRDKFPLLKPDLTVVSVDFANITTSVSGGVTTYTFNVVATIKNLGPGGCPSFDVLFQRAPVTDPHGSVPAGPNPFQVLPALSANAQVTASITGQTWKSGTPQRIYFVALDANNKIAEADEGNNNGQKTTPWTAPAPNPLRPAG